MSEWPTCACGCGEPVPAARTSNRTRGRIAGQPLRYVHGHNGRGTGTRAKQLTALIVDEPAGGCHEWPFARTDGYGYVDVGDGAILRVHRVAWEKLRGAIPDGLEVHHTCGNRACVNVGHMELLTKAEHTSLHWKLS